MLDEIADIFPNFILKVQDQSVTGVFGFRRLPKQWNLLLSIQRALLAYTSVRLFHPAAQCASAGVRSHLALYCISVVIHCPYGLSCVGGRILP